MPSSLQATGGESWCSTSRDIWLLIWMWDPCPTTLRHTYLDYLQKIGAPARSATCPKTPEELQAAADKGPHSFATAHREFLWEEAYKMCQRQHIMVLPLSAVKNISRVQFSPPMMLPQRNRCPQTICNLT